MTDQDNTTPINQEKKNYILSILQDLIGVWDQAEDLYNFVNSNFITAPMLAEIEASLDSSIKNIKDATNKKIMLEAKQKLDKIKEMERLEREKESLEADEMLANL